MESLAATRQKTGLVLDPRTKLLVLITVTTLMFSTSNQGLMNLVKPVLSLIPFALLLSARRVGTAARIVDAMRDANINIRMLIQGPGEINTMLGVENQDFEKAMQAIYCVFEPK